MKSIKDFDLEIERHLKNLISWAKKEHPNKPFYIDITYWEDKDYRIELTHNNLPIRYIYSYHKSEKKYKAEIKKVVDTWHTEDLSEIIIKSDKFK